MIGVDEAGLGSPEPYELPIYNMVPPPGVAAQFGFLLNGIPTFLDAGVRSGGDYGITEHADNITPQKVVYNRTTIWGVPAEASHNQQRFGVECRGEVFKEQEQREQGCASTAPLRALLTLPTSCGEPLKFTGEILATWEHGPGAAQPASFLSHEDDGVPTGLMGCENLGFTPSLSVAPDTVDADTPAGLTADVKASQEGLTSPEGLSTADLRDTTVTLPAGLVVNPGQAAGLVACTAAEADVNVGEVFGDEDPPSCPSASKVGTDEISTPLLPNKLEGSVYILQSNPPNLQLLVAASGEGVNFKIVGDVHLNETTGQLTTTFPDTPELPFTDFKLSFSGGAQAALATPTKCGVYLTNSVFTAWGSPFLAEVFAENRFGISSGPGGAPCASTLPFTPAMTAGATTDQAGGYTDFSMLLQQGDDQQRISNLQFKTPEGLLGMISKVALCGEPEAAQGTCSSASQIGHTVVTAGPGPYPLVVPEPGQAPAPIYLTGPYEGAPYGLSIAVPVITGPFNLGTVVVRARIEVDPHTSQLTITTGTLPSILDGIPTDLRTVNAVIDRPGFMFNPTNCNPMSFSGTATSTEGTTAVISSPFQMGSCRSLTFKPDFQVSTSGRTSRLDGASLDAKIVYPTAPLGANQASSQSNIASVKVELPKLLSSRLTTLQKACPAATFEANPAGCPAASLVGRATAVTPVLPVSLTGPVYFVSHGGEEFPSLIVVLQGDGVTVDLVGTTFISKEGITSSTFKQVPDVPITSFELLLPEGPYSALTAIGNLCKNSLVMPTFFTGQNGAIVDQRTPINVTGCAKTKRTKKTKKAKPTKSQELARALKVCSKKPRGKRAACQANARKHYYTPKKKRK